MTGETPVPLKKRLHTNEAGNDCEKRFNLIYSFVALLFGHY